MSGAVTDRGVHAAALASLPRAGPRRLHRLLEAGDPAGAWRSVLSGSVPAGVADGELRALWAAHAAEADLGRIGAALEALGARAVTHGDDGYPCRLGSDIDPAPIVFCKGRSVDPETPAVTIVGTRRCSPTGRSVAFELGAGLAEAGVAVVSGLALGVDGAAHRGALSLRGAPPVGVVGSGLNVVYPRGNSDLWSAVGEAGSLLSESPLDGRPEPWRFPARNRLLAALADVVVVVESKRAGGSMLTVEEALRRGVTVMAVPGSVRNPASAGTNLLISEGCAPACTVEDVLTAVGLAAGGGGRSENSLDIAAVGVGEAGDRLSADARERLLSDLQRRLLDEVDDDPVSLDRLMSRLGEPVPVALAAIADLEAMGLLTSIGGRVMRL